MTIRNSFLASDPAPSIIPEGAADVAEVRDKFTITATILGATLLTTDYFALVKLPADCVPVEAICYGGVGDTGASLLLDMGIMTAARTGFTDKLLNDGDYAQNGGVGYKAASPGLVLAITASPLDRWVGIIPASVPSGNLAFEVGISLRYRFAFDGE